MPRENQIVIEKSLFIFDRNFSGKPDDYSKNPKPNANIIIPTYEQACDIYDMGVNVRFAVNKDDKFRLELKHTTYKFEEFDKMKDDLELPVKFYVNIKADFVNSKWPPKIYTKAPGKDVNDITAETLKSLDNLYITEVTADCNKSKDGGLYINEMYVRYDPASSPYAARFFEED